MIDPATRQRVRDRAGNRCEYCRIHQEDDPFYRFHIEHIIPRQHSGNDDISNLALACHHCNLHKGPNLTTIDEMTSQVVALFDPRRQVWTEHFFIQGEIVRGMTAVGRGTIKLLAMNAFGRVRLRRSLDQP
jgi:predicted restriction endonuclease